MAELTDKWEVVSKLITLQNNYNFFKNEWDAERLYREIAKLEIEIGNTPGLQLVRCKDCQSFEQKWSWDNLNTGNVECCGYCYHWDYEQGMSPNQVDGDDFCSYGERRTEC